MIAIQTDSDCFLVPEAQIRSIRTTGARFDIELPGRSIETFYEPTSTTVVPASGVEMWQPVDTGDQVEWNITPVAALVVARGVVSGTSYVADIVPLSGDSTDCEDGVLVDRQRRLARLIEARDDAWSTDLATVLSQALGREVEVDHDRFAPLQKAA